MKPLSTKASSPRHSGPRLRTYLKQYQLWRGLLLSDKTSWRARKKTERIDIQQRPRLKFSIFSGKPEDFDIFLKNTERVLHLYPGREQRIVQIAELVTADIKPHILRYLNAGNFGPDATIEAMTSYYGMKNLVRPDLLARLKHMKTASSMLQIPATAEEILTILKALAQMNQDFAALHLPQNVLVHVFCALKLSTLKHWEVMGMVTAEFISNEEVKRFVSDRILFYSL